MRITWTKGLNKNDADEIVNAFKHNAVLRLRLVTILQEKIDASRKESCSKDGYDSPNWAFKQADSAGFIRGMHEIIDLLQENQQKKSIN